MMIIIFELVTWDRCIYFEMANFVKSDLTITLQSATR